MPKPSMSMKISPSTLLRLLVRDFSGKLGPIGFVKLVTGRERPLVAAPAALFEDIQSLSRPPASPASRLWHRPTALKMILADGLLLSSWQLIPAPGCLWNPTVAAPTVLFPTDLSLLETSVRQHLPRFRRLKAVPDGDLAWRPRRPTHTRDLKACTSWVLGLPAVG